MPQAPYIRFCTFDEKCEEPGHGEYHGAIDLDIARAPQTLLAYGRNGQPLPVAFRGPLRLRLESRLGYKMVKWIRQWNWLPATTRSAPDMDAGVLTSCITAVLHRSELVPPGGS
jgi:DMSO/TMAO reductase YedYZ molybdopterin-dependent catalytic subunit